jgi:hypothetical protein
MGVMVGASVGIITAVGETIGTIKVGGGGGAPHKEGWHATRERMLIRRKLKRVTLWLCFFNLCEKTKTNLGAKKYIKYFSIRSNIKMRGVFMPRII